MRTTFDINALRTIVAGVEMGSFARAATRLGRSQSAVSMHLKKLEEQTGQRLFRRNGRGLVPTEAGDALLAYARRIIALNDEAAASLGAAAAVATVKLGLPQDFAEDVLPDVIQQFSRRWPLVQIEAFAGRNYAIENDVAAGRLDVAIVFAAADADAPGTRIASLPMRWLGGREIDKPATDSALPLVLFDHPCLFRQAVLDALENAGPAWRVALTTPSLPGVWAALRSGLGITVRTAHHMPPGIRDVGRELGLPRLPQAEVRLIAGNALSPAASALRDTLGEVMRARVTARRKAAR